MQARRRRTVRWAIAQLLFSAVLFYAALQTRVQLGPGRYRVGIGGTTMVTTSLVLFGVSFVLLLRRPFRMPIAERMFRLIWLGAFGRWFLRRAARGLKPSATSSTGTTGSALTASVSAVNRAPPAEGATLTDLDRRVRSLEEWRRSEFGSR